MPLPMRTDVHVNTPLTLLSQAIIQQETNFVSGQAFPVVPVEKVSDKYFVFRQADFFRTDAVARQPGTETPGVGYGLSTPTYLAQPWGVHQDIDDQVRSNADSVLDLDMAATRRLTIDLLIRRETDWASNFWATSLWNADTVPSPTWDLVTSTPIEDIRARAYVMLQNTGYRPNTFVAGAFTDKRLRDHPDIKDLIKYTQRGIVTSDILAAMFDVDRYLVLQASQNTAAEGIADGQAVSGSSSKTTGPAPSYSFIAGGKNALLLYTPSAPGLMVPASGYNFAWTGFLGANAYGGVIRKFRMEWIRSDRIEAEIAFAHVLVAKVLGEYFNGAVAS